MYYPGGGYPGAYWLFYGGVTALFRRMANWRVGHRTPWRF